MPSIFHSRGAYQRERGWLPEFPLINMFLEKTPSTETGVVLLDRAPLERHAAIGGGPIQAMFSQSGTFNGALFVVSGNQLYRDGSAVGSIVGNGAASIASSGTELLVTAGDRLYSYTGVGETPYVEVAFPDAAAVRAVVFISGHFVAIREGSQKFYWSAQFDGRTWDALDFASAESEPDNLLDVIVMRGNLYLLGYDTIEPWFYTGDLALPFNLAQQRLFPKGVRGTGCAVEMDNALFWIAGDNVVYRTGDVPERLSDHGIEERIGKSTAASAYGFIDDGHSFFCVRLDAATMCYDAASGQWCEFQSYGKTNFRARSAVFSGGQTLLGDDSTGDVWQFGGYADEPILLREIVGAIPIKGGAVIIDNLTLDAAVGRTEPLEGQGSDPMVELETSRDGGATWGYPRPAAMGRQGEYRRLVRWRRMGMFDAPGAMFRLRMTDPARLRISDVLVNEPGGGRGR